MVQRKSAFLSNESLVSGWGQGAGARGKGVGDVRKGGVKVAGSGIPNVEVGGRNGKIGGGLKLPLP